jgi:hypothetical protein
MQARSRSVVALLSFLGFTACAGEVAAPNPSSQIRSGASVGASTTGSARQEEPPPPPPAAGSSASASPDGPTASATSTDPTVPPPPTWGSTDGCLLDPGPDAPGECKVGEERACPEGTAKDPSSSSGGPAGCTQKCVNTAGKAHWSQGTSEGYCAYYDTNLFIGAGKCACNTPLVLSFDDRAVSFIAEVGGAFDLSRAGICHAGDWPTAVTPWLAYDRNGNGAIDDGGELFGSATSLGAGAYAKNGFEALRELDSNGDGVFDARDPGFSLVVVWSDRNLDRRSSANELVSLAEAGVIAIDLHETRDRRCDVRGNCEGERSRFRFVDRMTGEVRSGAVIDVYVLMR